MTKLQADILKSILDDTSKPLSQRLVDFLDCFQGIALGERINGIIEGYNWAKRELYTMWEN